MDQGPGVGTGASAWQVDGFPMIAYEDAANGTIKFAQAIIQEPMIPQDWVIHTITSANSTYSTPCLRDMDGLPACSYYDLDTFKLMYACATTANPSSAADWEVVVADESFGATRMHSLGSVYHSLGGGSEAYSPAMSFYILSTGVFYLSGSIDPTGPGDFTRYLAALDGNFNSMTCAWGKPVIAYRNSTDDSLWVARAYTVEQEYLDHFFTYQLDSALHTVGDFISVAPVGLSFGVAYFDENNGNLRYASHSDLISP